jgi:trigger factor
MQTQVEELPENRVRLTVDVPSHDVQHAIEHAASDLAGNVKIPGFRKGHVPLPVLVSRIGRERLYAEAVESHIGGWFWSAAARERIHPVAQPEFAFDLPATDSQDWRFTATVEVQPKPDLPDLTELEVPRAEAEVPEDLIEHELNALRSSVAELSPVEDRPVGPTDTVVLDLVRPEGEAQRDYVVELGSGRLVEEIERGVIGISAGETRGLTFPLGDEEVGTVEVTVKEIKEKVLPPLDDELARAATEFDTLAELRSELERRLREQIEDEIEGVFRAAAVDKLVEAANVRAAGPLVESRARELLNGLVASVERRGVPFETYLQLTGANAEELVARVRVEAAQSVARELALAALADKLGIEVTDDEVESLVRQQAEASEDDGDAVLTEMRAEGAFERLRDDLRMRAALDRLAAEVKPISVELARAREKLWTPEQEKTPTDTKLWTPGSKEPA